MRERRMNVHMPGWNFTLTELLVVIAAIALPAGLLMSALNAAGEEDRVIACGSNLKEYFPTENHCSESPRRF